MRPLIALLFSVWVLAFVSLTASLVQADDAELAALDASPPLVTSDIAVATPPPDPIADPGKAIGSVRDVTKEHGIAAGVVLVLVLLASVAQRFAKPDSFLDRGRLPLIVAAASGVLGVLLAVLTGELPWTALLPALVTAAAMLWSPAVKR